MYRLSKRSLSRLDGVEPGLIQVTKRAIQLTAVDFGVSEGLRTEARQRELVRTGASRTMRSRHLIGEAVDVYAYVGGRARWELALYEAIAAAFRAAALECGIALTWGAAWPWRLTGARGADPGGMVDAYVDLRRSQGRKPFIDGPHFQTEP